MKAAFQLWIAAYVALLITTAPRVRGQSYLWENFVGPVGGVGSADGAPRLARFTFPTGVAVDGSGTLYVADTSNHTIRRISPSGLVTTLAGLAGNAGSADGTGATARFNYPYGVAVDASGTLYVADTYNQTIRKITPGGVVTTLAGLAGNPGFTNGTGTAARFVSPNGVAVDGSGTVFVADSGNSTIRKITPQGVVSTFAGTAGQFGSANGTGAAARFGLPSALAVDGSGNLLVADQANYTIRKITPARVVTTVAGTVGQAGSEDGTGTAAHFNDSTGVAVDSSGNVFVTDSAGGGGIRKITPAQVVTTLADTSGQNYYGVAVDGHGTLYVTNYSLRKITPEGAVTVVGDSGAGFGSVDGTGSTARFYSPAGLAADGSGTLYVADTYNQTIRKITPGGVVSTFAGTAGQTGSTNGAGSAALFNLPGGVAAEANGMLLVADTGNSLIRRIMPDGVVTTLAGGGSPFPGGAADGTGTAARFNGPQGVTVDGGGDVLVADSLNSTIRRITPAGEVTTLAGTAGQTGSADGSGAGALFNQPAGVAGDGGGTLFVADTANHTIRKITAGGSVTTLAGTAGSPGRANGTGSAASFNNPRGLAVNGSGTLLVADTGNSLIRTITPEGVVATLAGGAVNGPPFGSADGAGRAAQFNSPKGVAVDGGGTLYVADENNHTIRKITPAGVATTFAGSAGQFGSADGTGSAARFSGPIGVAVEASGTLYVADFGNRTIRKITTGGVVTTLAGAVGQQGVADGTGSAARFRYPRGLAVDGGGNILVADSLAHTIRKITPAGEVTTLAGKADVLGSANGVGTAALFAEPRAVTVDGSGTVYVADTGNHAIRKITPAGVVTTLPLSQSFGEPTGVAIGSTGNLLVADRGRQVIFSVSLAAPTLGRVDVVAGTGATGATEGIWSAARFNQPNTLAAGGGNIYVADTGNNLIRKITPAGVLPIPDRGVVSTLAGNNPEDFDGTGGLAQFFAPASVALDADGNAYVADTGVGHRAIRKITPAGVVTTLAGFGFNLPAGLAVAGDGTLYVADSATHTIRKITSAGVATTLAGTPGQPGTADGTGSAARFANPAGVALDGNGNLLVADRSNNTVRRITPDGVVTTLAGRNPDVFDGTRAAARFAGPGGIALDAVGNAYVADTGYHALRRVTPDGVVTTVAGTVGGSGSADGPGSAALFSGPKGVAVDGEGTVFVADTGNHTLRKMTSDGTVTTLAGTAGQSGSVDGTGSAARFNGPTAIAVDSGGNVLVADQLNTTIRKVTPAGVVTTIGGTVGGVYAGNQTGIGQGARFVTPSGLAITSTGLVYVADAGTNSILRGRTTFTQHEAWRLAHFGLSGNFDEAADAADLDGDGVSNLLEWACGLDPFTASPLTTTAMVEGNTLVFLYSRSVAAHNDGTGFAVEWSDTLAPMSWSASEVTETIPRQDDLLQQVRAIVQTGPGGQRFARLRVTAP